MESMESKCKRCKLCKPSCILSWNDDIVCDECFLGEPTSLNHAVKEIQDDVLSSSIWDDDVMTDTANLSVDLMINKQKPKDKDEAHTQLPNDNVSQVNISQTEPQDTADTTKFELVIQNNQDESIVCRRYQDKNPPDKNPPDINPRTKTPWTKTPLAKNPPDKNPPDKTYEHKIYFT